MPPVLKSVFIFQTWTPYNLTYLDTVVRMYFLDVGKLLRVTSNPREIPENSLCDEPVKIPQPFNGRRIEIQKVKYNNGACPIVHRIKKNGIYPQWAKKPKKVQFREVAAHTNICL